MPKHHKRDFAGLQILLIPDVLVCRQYDFETGLLSEFNQFSVLEFLPPPDPCFLHGVARKETGKASRRPVIEENQHPGVNLRIARFLFE